MLKREPIAPDMIADDARIAPVEPIHLSIRDAAAVWGVCQKTFEGMLATNGGPIRVVRTERRVLVPLAELRRVSKEEIEKQ